VLKYYRAEIDGIRALAIIPVVLFHTGFSLFEGGYVGVDVFFVISGYLITRLIMREHSENKFSLTSFYERRIRRILPALFFMILIITIIASFIMVPADLVNFYKSSIANTLFLSNIFFWTNINYFSNPTELIPLIHMWSISIEEQFYLVFPIIFIYLIKNLKLKKILIIFFIFSSLSVLFAQVVGNFNLTQPYMAKQFSFFYISSASFYLPLARAWELLIGCMIAIYLNKENNLKNKFSDLYIFLGIVFIIASIFFYNKNIPYASIYTILPVVGASLLILFLNNKSFFYFLFTNKLIIFFGLISYSLYLWHQPLFALYRIYFINEPKFYEYLLLIILAIIIAFFSWKYIEKPFRNRSFLSKNKIFILFLLISFLIIIFNFFGINSNGFNKIKFIENKLGDKKEIIINKPIETSQIINLQKQFLKLDIEKFKSPNNHRKILFIGDSHARDIYISTKLNEEYLIDYDFYKLTLGNNCLFFLEQKKNSRKKECEEEFDFILKNKSLINNSDYIIISMRYYDDPTERLKNFINKLKLKKSKIIIVGARNEFYKPVNLALNLVLRGKNKLFNETKLFLNRKNHTDGYNDKLMNFSQDNKIKFLDTFKISCNANLKKCDFYDENYKLYYYDYGHWTKEGAKFFGKRFVRELKQLISN